MSALLELRDVWAGYGRIDVVRGAGLSLEQGSLVALLGPNGAGKSTLLKVIAGQVSPRRGRVLFQGIDLAGVAAYDIARCGIYLVPEGRAVFPNLSVRENLRLASARPQHQWVEALDSTIELFPILGRRLGQQAGTMSGGEQRMLALARAFCAEPLLLLLDEPSLGLAPRIVGEVFGVIERFRQKGITILLVEQYVSRALAAASSAFSMAGGLVTPLGSTDETALGELARAYVGATHTPDARPTRPTRRGRSSQPREDLV